VNMMAPRTAAEEALGLSLPSRRDEEWKWTDLKRLIEKPYAVSSADSDTKTIESLIKSAPLAGLNLQRIIVVNGKLHSVPKGLVVSHDASAIAHDDPLLELNAKLNAKTVSLTFTGNVDQPLAGRCFCITVAYYRFRWLICHID
jgi:Fe-S cluster assembly protein SufD